MTTPEALALAARIKSLAEDMADKACSTEAGGFVAPERARLHTAIDELATLSAPAPDAPAVPAGLKWAIEHENKPGEVFLRFGTRDEARAYVKAIQAGMDAESAAPTQPGETT